MKVWIALLSTAAVGSCAAREEDGHSTQGLTNSLAVSADTYLKQGSPNQNQGALSELRLQESGNNRALVRIDQASLMATSSTSSTVSLSLTITDNGNNWGTTGRQIAIYRMTHDWSELGATWNCSVDTNTANSSPNCTGATAWEMGAPTHPELHPWDPTATATATITSGQSGVVTFDVSADAAAFWAGTPNYGWIIKKVDEGAAGRVEFGARESATPPAVVVDTPFITARYWRIEIAGVDQTQGSSAVLTEVEMQWGSTTHVLSGTTLTSPDPWGANGLPTLIDGELDQSFGCFACDYTYADRVPERLDFDLLTPQAVEAVLISQGGFREADGLEWTIADMNVYASNDGVSYTLVRAFAEIPRAAWTAQTLETFPLN